MEYFLYGIFIFGLTIYLGLLKVPKDEIYVRNSFKENIIKVKGRFVRVWS